MTSPSGQPSTVGAMWRTRPFRRQSERSIAGVAAAVGRRYAVDPVLVRIAFVVSAFYGVGVLLYLAGWAVLPPDPDDPPRGRWVGPGPGAAPHPVLLAALVVIGLIAAGPLLRDSGPLVALAVVALLLYLLHSGRGELGLAAAAGPASTGSTASTEGPPATPATDHTAEIRAEPPSAPTRGRRRASPLTPVTLGLALLAGAATVIAAVLSGVASLGWLRVLSGVLLGVIGLGLVVGSFTRGGRWLLAPAVPLIVLTVALTQLPPLHWHGGGDRFFVPATAESVRPGYELSVGSATVDLRRLDLTEPAAAPAAPVSTRVHVDLGRARVLLPPDADVRLHCHADVGDVSCLGRREIDTRGPESDVTITDYGADGLAGGRPIELDVTVGAGSVEVHRDWN